MLYNLKNACQFSLNNKSLLLYHYKTDGNLFRGLTLLGLYILTHAQLNSNEFYIIV